MRRFLFQQFWPIAFLLCGLALVSILVADDSKPVEEWKAPARAARKKNPIAPDDKSIASGKAIYVRECLSCHGEQGKGDGKAAADLNPKPRNLRDSKIWEQSEGSIFWKLSEGRKPMPTFEKTLSEDDRWNVINYIHYTFGQGASGSTTKP